MDWEGQRLAERLMQLILFAGGLISFLVGYLLKSYLAMMYGQVVSIGLTLLVTVPDWPFCNRHPRKWLDPATVKPEAASKVAEMIKTKGEKEKEKDKKQRALSKGKK